MKGTRLVASFRVMEVENGYLLSIEEAGAGGEPQRIYSVLPRTWYFKELKELAEGVLADVARQFLEDQEREAKEKSDAAIAAQYRDQLQKAINPALLAASPPVPRVISPGAVFPAADGSLWTGSSTGVPTRIK